MTRGGDWARLELPWDTSLELALPDANDNLADEVRREGKYFPPHFELALALVPPDGVILDLGAHLGTFALVAAASGRRVIAVEAAPRNIDLLRKSTRANRLGHLLSIVPVAVGDHSGMLRFLPDGAWGHIAGQRGGDDVVEVPARTAAEILAELGVARVDLVKIDVEGSEIGAINGMAALLSGPDAPGIVYEGNAHTLGMFHATPEDLVSTLVAFEYENYLIGERELTPVTAQSFQPETTVDYLAVKGALEPPQGWQVRRARTATELARVVTSESRHAIADYRAQIARSLERAPASLLERRDVRLVLSALALDPDDNVARAAAWWVTSKESARRQPRALSRDRAAFHALAEQGRALRNRLEQIRIRWGARP